MVKAEELLNVIRKRGTYHGSPNADRKRKRLQLAQNHYLRDKGNDRKKRQKQLEEARVQEMKKMEMEFKSIKGSLTNSQKIVNRMIRSARRSALA